MRLINSLFIGLFAAFATSFATGQEYPTWPVRIVVPNAPAGIGDIAARILGNRLSEVTAARRITLAPDWPTVSESGVSAEAQSEKYIPRI